LKKAALKLRETSTIAICEYFSLTKELSGRVWTFFVFLSCEGKHFTTSLENLTKDESFLPENEEMQRKLPESS
jgi:hypothetical protein